MDENYYSEVLKAVDATSNIDDQRIKETTILLEEELPLKGPIPVVYLKIITNGGLDLVIRRTAAILLINETKRRWGISSSASSDPEWRCHSATTKELFRASFFDAVGMVEDRNILKLLSTSIYHIMTEEGGGIWPHFDLELKNRLEACPSLQAFYSLALVYYGAVKAREFGVMLFKDTMDASNEMILPYILKVG